MKPIAAMVKDILETTDLVDPDDVTAKVRSMLGTDVESLNAALDETLRPYVRLLFPRGATPESRTPSSRSWRVDGTREMAPVWHEQRMAESTYVNGIYKAYGDCTADDLGWLAQYRRDKADGLLFEAKRHDSVCAALKRSRKTTVRQLPERKFAEAYNIGDAAA
jgi:hypothetical protein